MSPATGASRDRTPPLAIDPGAPRDITVDPGSTGAYEPTFGAFGMHRFHAQPMRRVHWHGHVEANWLEGGRMVYEFDGRIVTVPPQRLALFWASVPHRALRIEPLGDRPVLLHNLYLPLDTFLLMRGIDALRTELLFGGVVTPDADLCRLTDVARWEADYVSADPERFDCLLAELNALFRRVSLGRRAHLRKPESDGGGGAGRASAGMRHVVAMLRVIMDTLEQPVAMREITGVTGLNANYASNLFARTMRVSLKAFVVRMKIARARALLLDTDDSVQEIAFRCGFNSPAQFHAQFTRMHGLPAGEFRRRGRGAG